jgi:excisionase family DNA binding protein
VVAPSHNTSKNYLAPLMSESSRIIVDVRCRTLWPSDVRIDAAHRKDKSGPYRVLWEQENPMRRTRRENDEVVELQTTSSAPEAVRSQTVPFVQKLTCTINEACEMTGLGRTKLYELIGDGHLATTTVGRRRLVVVRSLLSLLESNTSV